MHNRSQFYIHSDNPAKLLASQLRVLSSRAKQSIFKIKTQNGNITADHKQFNDTALYFRIANQQSRSQ